MSLGTSPTPERKRHYGPSTFLAFGATLAVDASDGLSARVEIQLATGDILSGCEEWFFDIPSLGWIRVTGGRSAEVGARDPAALHQLLFGPALGLLLHAQQRTVLHGSAVSIHGTGVAILGYGGQGKSTIAAALRARGHTHISDGMCVIGASDSVPLLVPGPPLAKLWPDALLSLGFNPEPLARVLPATEKRLLPISGPMAGEPVPLSRIYVLQQERADQPSVAPFPNRAAQLWALVQNYYLSERIGASDAPAILRRCGLVAGRVPVLKFFRSDDINQLMNIAATIESDVARQAP